MPSNSGMGAQQSQISPEDLSIVRQETGFSDKEVERLFERFCELDRERKGFLDRTDFLAIPEISLNPVGDRIVHAFFKEGNSNKENDRLAFKNFALVMSFFSPISKDDPAGKYRREKKLRFAFSIYDLDDNGTLSRSVREAFNNPSHGNFPLGGTPLPPAPGAFKDEIFPKS